MSEDKTLFEKNLEMWEKWTNTYMETMAKAMDKTMEQSSAIQKQVDKAVSAALTAQLEATLAGIKSLERQMQTLSAKVDELLKKAGN